MLEGALFPLCGNIVPLQNQMGLNQRRNDTIQNFEELIIRLWRYRIKPFPVGDIEGKEQILMSMLASYLPIDEINDTRLQYGNRPETQSLVYDIPFVNMEKVVGTGPHQHYGGLNPRMGDLL